MLTPWKESYDQPRQHIQKQRHYFANKALSSQGYGFSGDHVWMWELDCEESWTLKNWWVWVNSGSWWWTGRPGKLRFMGSQGVGHDWATELNWTVIVAVPSLSQIWLSVTPWTAVCQAPFILHYFPKFAQIHVCWVSDHIQPSYPLSSPSPTCNLSQHQGLFQFWFRRISSSHQVAKVFELQHQQQSFQRTLRLISFRVDGLDLLEVPGDSQQSSLAPQFESFVIGIGRSICLWLFLKSSRSTPRCPLTDK